MFRTTNGATSSLPGVLWYEEKRDWAELVQRLGEVDRQRGRFRPFVEPSQFDGSDDAFVAAAEELLRLYVWSSTNHPDFDRIRTSFGLPAVEDVKALLTEAVGSTAVGDAQ